MKGLEQASAGAETPYLAARREWNERYGDYIQAANNWRLVALGAVAVTLLAVAGLIAVALQVRVVPYVVELDRHAEVVRITRADVLAKPSSNQIRAALRSWIIGARAVYSDQFALKELIDTSYVMTRPDSAAYRELAAYHRANNPYERAGKEAVTVDVHVINPVSDNTWRIEWTESTRQSSGKLVDTKDWQATVTIAVSPPTDEKQVMVNPLGVYVREFAWSARLPNQ